MSTNRTKKGFTLIELLVVIAIIALLMSIIVPALKMAKKKASAIVCMANLKSLSLGWYTYADEGAGRIMSATMEDCGPGYPCKEGWIGTPFKEDGAICDDTAVAPYEVTDADEIRGVEQGKLFAYNDDPDVYHCPGDNLRRAAPDQSKMFVSYSMAKCLYGTTNKSASWYDSQIRKITQIKNPSMRYNFVECGEMNLNWGGGGDFRIGSPEVTGLSAYQWWTPIGVNHGESSTFGFCDGHAERHKWTSGTALAQYEKGFTVEPGAPYGRVSSENDDDLMWLALGWPYH